MLTLVRTAVVVAAAVGMLGQPGPDPPPPGDGWGSVSCAETPSPACDLGAGSAGRGAAPRPAPGRAGGSGGSGGSAGRGVAGELVAPVRCSYVVSDFKPPAGGIVTASYTMASGGRAAVRSVMRAVAARPWQQPPPGQGQGQDGAWYLWRCSGNGARDALYRPPVWIPNGQRVPGIAGPSPAELADLARKRLRLPEPAIAASPVGDQLVNLPTWLWLGGDWAAVEATAAVPGAAVTARAVPVSVTWDMGDGTSVRCRGPGTPYRAGADPATASPDCGHTYRRSSAGMPGQAFTVTATVSWNVSWSGAGGGGTFPGITTTGNAAFRVAESQALVTGSG